MKTRNVKLAISVAILLVMLLSFFIMAPKFSKPESYSSIIAYLNDKQETVLELASSSTAASLALGAVPGDATTPIADKLMDMVGYFIAILCTIFLEKCLLSITGYLAFRILIPIAGILFLIFLWSDWQLFYRIAFKLFVFGLALWIAVPAGVKASQLIEKTNEASISSALNNLDEIAETEAETAMANEIETQASEDISEAEDSSTGIFSFIDKAKSAIEDAVNDVSDKASEAVDNVANASEELLQRAEDALNDVMQAVIVMLVTSCVIPILVLYAIWSLVKQVIGAKLDAPDLGSLGKRIHHE